MPLTTEQIDKLEADDRISPSVRRLLYSLCDHDPQDGSDVGGWGDLRQMFRELVAAGYLVVDGALIHVQPPHA
ncbi:MAG: hypothetical protein JWO67_1902 [Streptosporangiaceae bacterium]|nr:hypothetical protein [Streptosporangiaceae bacterium]